MKIREEGRDRKERGSILSKRKRGDLLGPSSDSRPLALPMGLL